MGLGVVDQMSYAAAEFILEKSNKMLLMFKALKRKTTANTATTAQRDTSISSMTQSKQTSAVNCMHLDLNLTDVCVLQCENNSSDAYTEINLHNELPTAKLVTQPSPTDSNDFVPSNILRLIFNGINSVHNSHNHNQSESINPYVNEPFTSNMITRTGMKPIIEKYTNEKCFYEIDSSHEQSVANQMAPEQQLQELNELAGSSATQSIRSNTCIVNTCKSKCTTTDDEAKAAVECEQTNNVNEKASFKKRLKFKFKAGFQFFKDAKVRLSHSENKFSLKTKIQIYQNGRASVISLNNQYINNIL